MVGRAQTQVHTEFNKKFISPLWTDKDSQHKVKINKLRKYNAKYCSHVYMYVCMYVCGFIARNT